MDRRQAEVEAAACHKAATPAQPVTPDQLDAALTTLESRMIRWMLVIGGAVVAAAKLVP